LAQGISAPPEESALGALLAHLQRPVKKFQPSNVNYGLTPELAERAKKDGRKALYADRARKKWEEWRSGAGERKAPCGPDALPHA